MIWLVWYGMVWYGWYGMNGMVGMEWLVWLAWWHGIVHMCYKPSLVGQDGWILAKVFFAFLLTERKSKSINTQKRTRPSLVNKVFITRPILAAHARER